MVDLSFYKGKRVLVTGHTGFKGTWLCKILINAGAFVVGYSLEPPTNPNLFSIVKLDKQMVSIIGDIRDFNKLKKAFDDYNPEIVIHLAAQPIVRDSYKNPLFTYETNVLGTVNILECVRLSKTVKSFLNVTTDKVYLNEGDKHLFKEDDPLDGYDPYSNSKSCSELVTHSYKKSFFADGRCAISTARAGNVIGGGDFANDRIIPDCIRAIGKNEKIVVRNPYSTRPYQHVLEPVCFYLELCEKQYKNIEYEGFYNVGPDEEDAINTGKLVDKFCLYWGDGASWINISDNGPHEAAYLALDNGKIKDVFNWKPTWHIDKTIEQTVQFYKVYFSNLELISNEMDREIELFLGDANEY